MSNNDNTKDLFGIAEQRRQHLSNFIGSLNALAITVVIGIWAFLSKEFIDTSSFIDSSKEDILPFAFSFIVFAAGLSSIVITLWRLYVKYCDNLIADLYPEILEYEIALGMITPYGIMKHIRSNKTISESISELSHSDQQKVVGELVNMHRIGTRGHNNIDGVVCFVLFVFLAIIAGDIYLQVHNKIYGIMVDWNELLNNPLLFLKWAGYILFLVSLIVEVVAINKYQKEPSQKHLNNALMIIKTETKKIQG